MKAEIQDDWELAGSVTKLDSEDLIQRRTGSSSAEELRAIVLAVVYCAAAKYLCLEGWSL